VTHTGRRTPSFLEDLLVDSESPPREAAPPVRAAIPRRSGPRSGRTVVNPELLEHLKGATPSQIGVGRTGTRYRTDVYLKVRSDHSIAKDAVYRELPEDMASQLGCIEVRSRCTDRENYLLNPNLGRRLSPESVEALGAERGSGADVHLILADGLAAPAAVQNGPILLARLREELIARGISVGTPILARMARVGLQDDIGVLLGSKATAICLGERPGLGTGDSLSIYIAVAPKLDQDNAEKNCISNVRPLGLSPEQGALAAVDILQRGLAAGRSGLGM